MSAPLEILVERDQLQRILRLEEQTILVGRGLSCSIRLEDPMASREHCRLERHEDEVQLVDLNSSNGTWMAGEKVSRRCLLPGDEFRIGSTRIRLQTGQFPAHSASESTLTQQSSREKRMLQSLLGVARALQEEYRPEQMAPVLIDAAVMLTGAERGFVFLIEGDETTMAVGRNFARESVPSPEQKVSRTLLENALASQGPLLVEDAASDGEFSGVASIADLGLRSLLAIPLQAATKVVGLLVVDHRLQGGAFSRDEIELLEGCASLASLHLAAGQNRLRARALKKRVDALQRQLGQRILMQESAQIALPAEANRFPGFLGVSPAMNTLFEQMDKVLEGELPVLISGESGTGKEMVARVLHFRGVRASKPFVVVNCGALPDTLLESELFGHKKGSFTGAVKDRTGRLAEANGGTLFLDEVGEMSSAMQARFLRFLEKGEIQPLGSSNVETVDVRVLSATNLDLSRSITKNEFREDLFYRLCVIRLELPPLRNRVEDISLLAEHFLRMEAVEQDRLLRTFSEQAKSKLSKAYFPGNVRQLRNEMRRLALMGEGEIQWEELDQAIVDMPRESGTGALLEQQVQELERKAIASMMDRMRGNRTRAAEALGITRYSLNRKLQKYGLETKE